MIKKSTNEFETIIRDLTELGLFRYEAKEAELFYKKLMKRNYEKSLTSNLNIFISNKEEDQEFVDKFDEMYNKYSDSGWLRILYQDNEWLTEGWIIKEDEDLKATFEKLKIPYKLELLEKYAQSNYDHKKLERATRGVFSKDFLEAFYDIYTQILNEYIKDQKSDIKVYFDHLNGKLFFLEDRIIRYAKDHSLVADWLP
jgi:hypothetical protein